MALPKEPRILIIDGNNLAHHLYPNLLPGRKMTPDDSRRLVEHLGSYARNYPERLNIELCLDRSPGELGNPPENLRILFAEYPQTGDDLLLGRFWFHTYSHRPCLVVSNDEGIRLEVTRAGEPCLLVYDFVRRPGLISPAFLDPQDFPPLIQKPGTDNQAGQPLTFSTSIYFRIVEEDRAAKEKILSASRNIARQVSGELPSPIEIPRREPDQPGENGTKDEAIQKELTMQPPVQETAGSIEEYDEESPYYFLSPDTWPVGVGVRFLLSAFCPQHREQYHDLMSEFDPDSLRPVDLRALAELLLHACGGEPDFSRRGALMNRVRLALLHARGEPLSLTQLAEQTGLKRTGLRGRIKQKAYPWIEILTF